MGIHTRIETIDRDIDLILRNSFSPAARSQALAEFAREQLSEAQRINRKALGAVPPHQSFVDGSPSDRLDTVRPDGEIAFEFALLTDAVRWTAQQLELHSPKLSGDYSQAHALFADGVAVKPETIPAGVKELAFINMMPYARKIERGLSNQAPDGVYQVVAEMASRRFGNLAKFRFTYRSPFIGYVRGGRGREGRAIIKNGAFSHVNLAMKYERGTREPTIVMNVV